VVVLETACWFESSLGHKDPDTKCRGFLFECVKSLLL